MTLFVCGKATAHAALLDADAILDIPHTGCVLCVILGTALGGLGLLYSISAF